MSKTRNSVARRQYQTRSKATTCVGPFTENEKRQKLLESDKFSKRRGLGLHYVSRKRKANEINEIFDIYSPVIKLQRLECFETRYNADYDMKTSAEREVCDESNGSSYVKRKETLDIRHPDTDAIIAAYKPVVKIERLKSLERACNESSVSSISFSYSSLGLACSKNDENGKRKADERDIASFGHPFVKLQRLAFLERACSEFTDKDSVTDATTVATDISSKCITDDGISSAGGASHVTDVQVAVGDEGSVSHSPNSFKNQSFQSDSDIFNSSSASDISRDSIGNYISSDSSFDGSLNNSFSYLRELI